MKLSNLATVLRRYGLTVIEHAGWQTRGYAGQDLAEIRGVLWHHTATNRNAFVNNSAPTLQLCINGRSDLPGPLCQIVFGRDGAVHLIAAGVGNHAGRGGFPAVGAAKGIPTHQGNHYLIGIEMESSGVAPWDWTDDQKRVAPYLGAALSLGVFGGKPHLQIGHMEYSSEGKIDPAGWPGGMDGLRAQINAKEKELSKPVGQTASKPKPVSKARKAVLPGVAAYTHVPGKKHFYKVRKGNTLTQISEHYGASVDWLVKTNKIKNKNQIAVGQELRVR